MYNIYYALKDDDWEGVTLRTNTDTVIKALMVAVRELRVLLQIKEIELLPVNGTEFVIWACGTCKGYLSLEDIATGTPAEGLDGG